MARTPAASNRFQSWPASILLFTIATLGEFSGLAGWYWLHRSGTAWLAPFVLLAGFVIERYVVVLWLSLPRRVITPGGNLRALWLVLVGVTIAEIAAWVLWIHMAEARSLLIGTVILAVGIHLVHSYEVAVIKHRTLRPVLRDRGVITLTGLEVAGGVVAFLLVTRSRFVWAATAMLLALLFEHLFQVTALKREQQATMPDAARV
jgi:hypothetical protein